MATGKDTFQKQTVSQKLLHTGQKILYKEKWEFAIFSGKISLFGITVGHIGTGKSIEIHDPSGEHVIAEIVGRLEGPIKAKDEEYTADISFLRINSRFRVKTSLLPKPSGEHKLVLHKGVISPGEHVMVVNEEGFMQQGKIKSSSFNWKDNGTQKEVINALCIVDDNNHSIADRGQSGALVTSCPQEGSDVLRVYGIVTHIHESNNKLTSATIANRLWDVLRVHHNSGQCSEVRLGDTLEKIDFAQG